MTVEEAAAIRKRVARLYHECRVEYFAIYYKLLQKVPGDPQLDDYIQSRWEESRLEGFFHDLGAYGYQALIEDGWNPMKPPDEDGDDA